VIRLTIKDNADETVTVTDQASGIYLAPDSTARLPAGARRPGPPITTPPIKRPPASFMRPAPSPRQR
jgi:hypothetical protein